MVSIYGNILGTNWKVQAIGGQADQANFYFHVDEFDFPYKFIYTAFGVEYGFEYGRIREENGWYILEALNSKANIGSISFVSYIFPFGSMK